jgi:ribosomal protein S18 acetylase RimI-like enzyme
VALEQPYTVRTARPDEIDAAVAVQHRAFTRVALMLGFEPQMLPPVSETAGRVRELLATRDAVLLVAVARGGGEGAGDEIVIGTVRGVAGDSGTVEVGRLAVEDGYERRGIGRALMVAVEDAFPSADRFELFTGSDAVGPLRLYDSLGYTVMRNEDVVTDVPLVWLEKCRSGRVDSKAHDR